MTKQSFCKVNLLLNILGKRADGFHELETVMQPVALCDTLAFERGGGALQLTCSDPALPTDRKNLVFAAAEKFLAAAQISEGMKIHLDKKIPIAAGLGGGSGNAATTLLACNELFDHPLSQSELHSLAASLGSDVPFFLQSSPALATGRGEIIQPLAPFAALQGRWLILVHPGFGVSTGWAYQELAKHPEALHGRPGRAQSLITLLRSSDIAAARQEFYNSLEAPVLRKYPLLHLFQEFFRENGADLAMMSGSGSTTFAIASSQAVAEKALAAFVGHFGDKFWTALVPLAAS